MVPISSFTDMQEVNVATAIRVDLQPAMKITAAVAW